MKNTLVTPENIEIALTASGGSLVIPRFWYFIPKNKKKYRNIGIRGSKLNIKEVEKVSKLYKKITKDDLFVWLSPKPAAKMCYKIDASKIDPNMLRQPEWSKDLLCKGDITANCIVNIAYPDTINEKQFEIVELLKTNCSDYLNEGSILSPLFIGMTEIQESEKVFFNSSTVLLKDISNNLNGYPKIISENMEGSGFNAILKSAIVTGDIERAKNEGGLYVVFPLNGYSFTWSNIVKEHISHLSSYDKVYPATQFGIKLKILDYWKSISSSYKNTNLKEAISSHHEILLSGPGYYAVEAGTFASIIKNGLMEDAAFQSPLGESGTFQYWYNVYDEDIVLVGKNNANTHSGTVTKNPGRFELDDSFITDDLKDNIDASGYDPILILEMLKLGWVRIDYDNKEISIEAISEKNAHKALLAIMSIAMIEFKWVYIDIRYGLQFGDLKHINLSGSRLEYFLKRGIVPTGMVREAEK